MIDGVLESLADLPEDVRDGAHLAFTTHSIPTAAADTSGPVEDHGDGGAYVAQHLDVARLVADAVRERDRRRAPLAARLPVAQRRPAHPVAGAGHLRPPGGAARRRRPGGRDGADRLRLGPHGGAVRPRHRGHGQGRGAGPAGAPLGDRRAPTRGSPPPCATSSWSAPRPSAARRSSAAPWARSAPSHDLCPVGCCPARAPQARRRRRRQPVRMRSRRDRAPARPNCSTRALEAARRAGELLRDGRPADLGGRRHQVQPDRRRHRDGHRRREADHRPDRRAPPGRRLPRRGGRRPPRARAASAGSSTRSTAP